MRCMVVDESLMMRRVVCHALEGVGFEEIVQVSSGDEALERCDGTMSMVITDWNMPGMDGLELVRRLRAKPELSAVAILMVTARTAEADLAEATQAGVNGYLMKPIAAGTLRAKVEALLHRGKGGAEASAA